MYIPWWVPCSPPPPPPPPVKEEQQMSGSEGCRRRVRTSAKQFELILDFMERHPNLATSQLDSSYTLRDRKREWAEFAHFLNSRDLGVHKDADKWRKTWFDWKCNVRAKARSASGKKSLTPLEERLVAVTRMLDTEDSAAARRDAPSYGETVYDIEEGPAKFSAAGALSHAADDDDDSAESVTPNVDSTYGESQGEYIVPTSSVMSTPLRLVLPTGQPPLVLSDVRSLAGPSSHGGVVVKQEVVDDDGEDTRDLPLLSTSSTGSSPRMTEETLKCEPHAGSGDHRQGAWFRNRKRPATDGHDDREHGSVASWNKARLEIEVLLATKRKLEADKCRAKAEAEFYEQEKKRSMALASLHQEEKRKMAAMADFHVEERRRAAAKAEMLVEHRNFYVEQQKTEALRRRLIQLEIQRLKKELGKPAVPALPPE